MVSYSFIMTCLEMDLFLSLLYLSWCLSRKFSIVISSNIVSISFSLLFPSGILIRVFLDFLILSSDFIYLSYFQYVSFRNILVNFVESIFLSLSLFLPIYYLTHSLFNFNYFIAVSISRLFFFRFFFYSLVSCLCFQTSLSEANQTFLFFIQHLIIPLSGVLPDSAMFLLLPLTHSSLFTCVFAMFDF